MRRPSSFRIGPCIVTPSENLIERAAGRSRIQPRAMDVLVYLVEHAGEVVSAEALMAAVWRGRIVTIGSVYQSIRMLRRALGDGGPEARCIETVPKRGYRLIAAVEPLSPAAAARPASVGIGLLAAAIAAIAVVAATTAFDGALPGAGAGPSALLPEWRQAALIDVATGPGATTRALASDEAGARLAGALYLRARTALKPLVSRFEPIEALPLLDEAIAHDPGFAPAYALKAYLLGPEQRAEAVRLVERALTLDPGLGMAQMVRATLHEARWEGEQARRAYRRALELSPDDPWILGRYAYFNSITGRHGAAIRLATRLVELEPSAPDSYRYLARAHLFAGHSGAAAATMRRAAELDPIDPSMHLLLGLIEASRGHQAGALQALRLAEKLLPDRGEALLASIAYGYGLAGRRDEALRVLAQWEQQCAPRVEPSEYPIRYYLARGEYRQARERVRAAIEAGEPPNIPLLQIMTNLFSEPVLEEPQFAEVRTQLRFRN